MSSSVFPSTGIAKFDDLMNNSAQAQKVISALQRRGVAVVDHARQVRGNSNAHVVDINGVTTIVYNGANATCVDLLHESRHVAQVQRLQRAGLIEDVNGINGSVNKVKLAERGVYAWARRSGNANHFSEAYMGAINDAFSFNAPPKSVMQSVARGSSMRQFVQTLDPALYGW